MSVRAAIRQRMKCASLILAVGTFAGCASFPVLDSNGRVYHCVGTDRPLATANTWAKKMPLEAFEYGDYRRAEGPTISGNSYCSVLRVPKTAYIRYRVDDRVIEKRFDLSSLSARRVHKKTVEFYVDEDIVEVRLLTPVPGRFTETTEVIVRQ